MAQQKSKKNKYRKDKPWDNDPDVDKWKMPQLDPNSQHQAFFQESSFATLYPKYREKYIKESFTLIKKKLFQYGIKSQLNLIEGLYILSGSLTVRTSKKTRDPYAIIKARDVIKLISRSVPFQHALRVMQDNIYCDFIKIRSYLRNTSRFVKRRQRLIGPNGGTLKALQILTKCYILVQGSTVCIIGQFKPIKILRRIIIDTMQNIHPIYHIKQLMIKRELINNQQVKSQNWERFLPKFKKIRQKRKKKKIQEKQYNPFPPQPIPRKEDLQMLSGQYFLTQTQNQKKKTQIKTKKQLKKAQLKKEKKQKIYQEPGFQKQKDKLEQNQLKRDNPEVTIQQLQQKFKVKKRQKLF